VWSPNVPLLKFGARIAADPPRTAKLRQCSLEHYTRLIMFTVGNVILFLSLTVIAIPNVRSAQSAYPSAQSAPPLPLQPMPADANPTFEVATIKPSDTTAPHGRFFRLNGRHVIAYNMSVKDLITYAFGLHTQQIVDSNRSLLAKHFDIDGLPDVMGHPNHDQSRSMFQKLLVSRFKLAFHYESRELFAYAIQIARGGPKLTLTSRKPGEGTEFTYTCQALLTVRNYSMADIAKSMQEAFLDRPVVDRTDLKGCYDFDLKWTPDESQSYCPPNPARSRDDPNASPDFYTAVQEQLGLRIVPTKTPIPVMVIDHIETPSEN
jgi:uncharacterized protein (TIGR03435 family)